MKFEIISYLENPDNKFISKVLSRLKYDKEIGYAGYKDKKSLKMFLECSIFGDKKEK